MGVVVYRQGEVSESEREGERGQGREGREEGREHQFSKPYTPRLAIEVDTLGLIPPNSNDRYPYSFT